MQPRISKTVYIIFGLLALLILGVVAYALSMAGQQTDSATDNQTQVPNSSQNNTGAPTGNSPTGTEGQSNNTTSYPVLVYFSKHPDSDDDPSKVFSVNRTSSSSGVGTYALQQLLKGPTADETTAGYFSTVRLRDGTSTCGGADFTLSIKDGTATLQFCKQFDHLGVVADGQADTALKATLKQFNSVQKVVILNSRGDCEFDLSGQNLCKQ